MKKFANGIYSVKITEITTGESSIKRSPFIELTYSNGKRYIKDRIHISKNGWKYLSLIFWKAGLDYARNSIDELIGSRIGIEVISGGYVSHYGEYRTFGKLGTIYSSEELIDKNENTYDNTFENYYDRIDNDDDGTSIADIFGVDIGDVASGMGRNASEISNSDIREYCGY